MDPYLDKTKFPLTTQDGLDRQEQRLIDSINHDDLKRMQEEGRPLDPERRQILLELQQKAQMTQGEPPPPKLGE